MKDMQSTARSFAKYEKDMRINTTLPEVAQGHTRLLSMTLQHMKSVKSKKVKYSAELRTKTCMVLKHFQTGQQTGHMRSAYKSPNTTFWTCATPSSKVKTGTVLNIT